MKYLLASLPNYSSLLLSGLLAHLTVSFSLFSHFFLPQAVRLIRTRPLPISLSWVVCDHFLSCPFWVLLSLCLVAFLACIYHSLYSILSRRTEIRNSDQLVDPLSQLSAIKRTPGARRPKKKTPPFALRPTNLLSHTRWPIRSHRNAHH